MNKGIVFAAGCYVIWGVFPIYWKALHVVSSVEIVSHRLMWSLVFMVVLMTVARQWRSLREALTLRTVLIYLAAGALLTVNWLVYIYGVNAGFVVETSLGYFINPLVSVMFGVLFLGEKLPPSRWIPVLMAAVGVTYLTISYGSLPWIALALAFSFGLYGLFKKISPLGAMHGLTLETGAMFLPALGYLLWAESQGTAAFGHVGPGVTVLIVLSGVVTSVPLLLFASAARRIPLSMIGILQYIAPTLQFLLGVFLYNEPFTHERLIGFSIIWLALIVFTLGGLYERRKSALAAAAAD